MTHSLNKGSKDLSLVDEPKITALVQRSSAHETTVIKQSPGLLSLDLRELIRYRQLIYFMAWRDVKVKYKQAVFGISWAVIQPVVTMLVFTAVFGSFLNVSTDGDVPYPIFAYAALVPWTFFSNSLTNGASSVVENASLVEKIYFPRVILPVSAIMANLLDLAIAFVVLVGLMVWYGQPVTLSVLAIPGLVLLAICTALGVSLWISALNVRYRDFRYGITFIATVWLYATPVAYSASAVPERWELIYSLNPMVGVVEGFRWALLETTSNPSTSLVASAGVVAVLLLTGFAFFRRTERSFADVI